MKKTIIKSRAPVRISFAGGGTDVSPFPEKYGGAVINASISRYVTSALEFRTDKKLVISVAGEKEFICPNIQKLVYDGHQDLIKAVIKHLYHSHQGLNIYIKNDVPPQSGLGGSSTLFISIIGLFNALLTNKLDKYQIAELAYKLEREELKIPGGRQDQYAAVFGGINFIEFKGQDFVRVTPLDLPKEIIAELEESLILLHLGPRKESSTNIIISQTKNVQKGGRSLEPMMRTKKMALKIKEAFLSNNLKKVGKILDESWKLKKKFAAGITNPQIEDLYARLKKKGALGGKLTGAGGGGHMLIYCEFQKRNDVEKEALKWGAQIVPFRLESHGMTTWES